MLVGVFDGHGGGACAQVIAKRLFNYITACLLPHDSLLDYVTDVMLPKPPDLLERYNDKVQFVEDVRDIYKDSFIEFIKELAEVSYYLVLLTIFISYLFENFQVNHKSVSIIEKLKNN